MPAPEHEQKKSKKTNALCSFAGARALFLSKIYLLGAKSIFWSKIYFALSNEHFLEQIPFCSWAMSTFWSKQYLLWAKSTFRSKFLLQKTLNGLNYSTEIGSICTSECEKHFEIIKDLFWKYYLRKWVLNYGNLTEIKIIKYLSVEQIEKIKDVFFYEKDRMNKLKYRKSVMRYTWSKKRSKKICSRAKKMLFAPELSFLKNALCSEQKSGARAKKICSRAK